MNTPLILMILDGFGIADPGKANAISVANTPNLDKLFKEESINLSNLNKDTIIVAKELTTSETAKLDFSNVSGIITEIGGMNSHSSIMARTHLIPAIKLEKATSVFEGGEYIAIDGITGEIYLNPNNEEKEKLLNKKAELEKEKEELILYLLFCF